jgi:hypothetical protein
LFRTTTRYSIFILCIALMFGVRRLSVLEFPTRASTYITALLFIWIALWDQIPPLVTAADLAPIARDVASDRGFVETMEGRLPKNAMVFQVPVIDFPENPTPNFGPYDNFRPYLYSQSLHFSFGSDKGRVRELWQHDVIKVPLAGFVARLERYGFSALCVDLSIFPDKGAGFLAAIRDEGHTDLFQSDKGDLLCVLLKPSPQPVWPDAP